MPTEIRTMRPEDGWPISHLNAGSAAFTKLADSPGANQSWFITGFVLSGAGDGDSFSFLRGASLRFDDAADTFTVTNNAALDPDTGDFAIVFGIKAAATAVSLTALISKDNSGDGWKIAIDANGKLVCTVADDGANAAAITSYNSINDGELHWVVINIEAGETDGLRMLIDNESAADDVDISAVGNISGAVDLIITGGTSKTFDISVFGLYKGQFLSSAEMDALWADGAGSKFIGDETGLSAAWNIDEGISTAHADLVASNDGSSANTAWIDGVGFPVDPHTLKKTIAYAGGIIDRYPGATSADIGGVIPIAVVNLPHAIKIGRNNPIRIDETSGAWELELYGFKGSYA